MATETNQQSGSNSGMVRAAVAAAATGAAAYGIRRLRSRQEDEDTGEDEVDETSEEEESEGRGGLSAKREELTQALSTKVTEAKNAASKVMPGGGGGRRTTFDYVRGAASDQLLPVAKEAASSLGSTVAKKAPDVVRDELMPRFIEGFEKTAG